MTRKYSVELNLVNFDAIRREVMPVIIFQARNNHGKLKGYDIDDLVQEFTIKLWEVLRDGKIPTDMLLCDYRFERWLNRVLANEVNMAWRRRINRYRKRVYGVTVFNDYHDLSTPLSDWELLESGSSLFIDELEIEPIYANIFAGEERDC